jgi:hypothetical protein
VATDDGTKHPEKEGRVKELLDRLADVLRGLPPDRQQAFQEYLNEQIAKEADNGGDPAEEDPGDR